MCINKYNFKFYLINKYVTLVYARKNNQIVITGDTHMCVYIFYDATKNYATSKYTGVFLKYTNETGQ